MLVKKQFLMCMLAVMLPVMFSTRTLSPDEPDALTVLRAGSFPVVVCQPVIPK